MLEKENLGETVSKLFYQAGEVRNALRVNIRQVQSIQKKSLGGPC